MGRRRRPLISLGCDRGPANASVVRFVVTGKRLTTIGMILSE